MPKIEFREAVKGAFHFAFVPETWSSETEEYCVIDEFGDTPLTAFVDSENTTMTEALWYGYLKAELERQRQRGDFNEWVVDPSYSWKRPKLVVIKAAL
jgi:hypothetical protein